MGNTTSEVRHAYFLAGTECAQPASECPALVISAHGAQGSSLAWVVDDPVISRHFAIHAYSNENLTLLHEGLRPLLLKSRSEDGSNPTVEDVGVPNKADEATIYLKYICDHYDALPPHMYFIHGNQVGDGFEDKQRFLREVAAARTSEPRAAADAQPQTADAQPQTADAQPQTADAWPQARGAHRREAHAAERMRGRRRRAAAAAAAGARRRKQARGARCMREATSSDQQYVALNCGGGVMRLRQVDDIALATSEASVEFQIGVKYAAHFLNATSWTSFIRRRVWDPWGLAAELGELPHMLAFKCCAHFRLVRAAVRQHPAAFYRRLYDSLAESDLLGSLTGLPGQKVPYSKSLRRQTSLEAGVMEALWPTLFAPTRRRAAATRLPASLSPPPPPWPSPPRLLPSAAPRPLLQQRRASWGSSSALIGMLPAAPCVLSSILLMALCRWTRRAQRRRQKRIRAEP